MRYYRYIATEGKVLVDLDDFSYGISMSYKDLLDIIEMIPEDAEYFYDKFQEGTSREDILTEITAKGYDLNNKVEPIIIN